MKIFKFLFYFDLVPFNTQSNAIYFGTQLFAVESFVNINVMKIVQFTDYAINVKA